jgi:hypothetical protein
MKQVLALVWPGCHRLGPPLAPAAFFISVVTGCGDATLRCGYSATMDFIPNGAGVFSVHCVDKRWSIRVPCDDPREPVTRVVGVVVEPLELAMAWKPKIFALPNGKLLRPILLPRHGHDRSR